jgi:hypothetical protein
VSDDEDGGTAKPVVVAGSSKLVDAGEEDPFADPFADVR